MQIASLTVASARSGSPSVRVSMHRDVPPLRAWPTVDQFCRGALEAGQPLAAIAREQWP